MPQWTASRFRSPRAPSPAPWNCCAVFLAYLFAGVTVFYSDLPYLPWWADGMGVALMLTIPSATIGSGKENRLIPMLLNAVLLGFLISVAERYLG